VQMPIEITPAALGLISLWAKTICKLSSSITIILLVSGCGPTIRTKLAPNTELPTHIALLPANTAIDIPKERIDLVRNSVLSELRNRGFVVADEKVVSSICSTPACPERTQLSKEYLIDGFASLSIDSFSKNSFLAGYYNQLAGSLSVVDRNGRELIAIDHTESERGGLIFNSGQVIQGIISQVNNAGDAAYRELSSQFAKTIVSQLPAATNTSNTVESEALEVVIRSATAQWSSATSYTVCLVGTPNSIASVIVGSQRTSLRETNPGRYCGAFSPLVAASTSGSSFVELRTAYGNSVREAINLPSAVPCELENRLLFAQNTLNVACSSIGGDISRVDSGCSQKTPLCKAERLVLYTADAKLGAYKRAAEARQSSIRLPEPGATYEVVAMGIGGISSTPVRFPETKVNQ
jgi:hypothetical protein